jgi:hypothetical protein
MGIRISGILLCLSRRMRQGEQAKEEFLTTSYLFLILLFEYT